MDRITAPRRVFWATWATGIPIFPLRRKSLRNGHAKEVVCQDFDLDDQAVDSSGICNLFCFQGGSRLHRNEPHIDGVGITHLADSAANHVLHSQQLADFHRALVRGTACLLESLFGEDLFHHTPFYETHDTYITHGSAESVSECCGFQLVDTAAFEIDNRNGRTPFLGREKRD